MKYQIKNTRNIELLVYVIIWLIVLLMPIFFSQYNDGINWSRVSHEWIKIIPFLIIFLIHNYLLFPFILIPKKYWFYFGSTLLIIIGVSILSILIGREVGPSRGIMPQSMDLPPFPQKPVPGGELPLVRIKIWQLLLFEDFITSMLVIGFNAAIKLTVKWQDEEQKNKELEKQKLETELAFLKNQISPHFFMNTLNNIHALVDINQEDAKESIIKLSKLMRYLLYDTENAKTTLTKEIEFIKSYVDLMRLRFTSQVSVHLSFPETIPNIKIPPMLFTSLLENAFKHGVSYQYKSFIEIIMKTNREFLFFRIRNSIQNSGNGLDEKGGIGLENLRKRLDLIYDKSYSLVQNESDKEFEINIKLPLNED
jgi:uncharacterized protein (DUF2164 family)